MPSSTLTSKGQVTIPKEIRERLGLIEGDTLEFSTDESGQIVVRRLGTERGVCGVLDDFAPDKPVSVLEMNRAVRRRAKDKTDRDA